MKLTILHLIFICIQLDCAVPQAGNGDIRHGEGEPSHHPVNVAVIAGQSFTFQCIPNSSEGDTLVSGISFVSALVELTRIYSNLKGVSTVFIAPYSVNPLSDSNGVELSLIGAATAEFAGTYICYYANDSSYWSSAAELVVMASDPTCSAERDVNTNTTVLYCALNFTGAYYPRMEWYSSNGTLMRTCDEQSVRYTDGLFSLRCDVNVSMSEGEGAECRTFFTDAGRRNEALIPFAMYSRQIPSYSHTYTTVHRGKNADDPSSMEQDKFQELNNPHLLIILVAASGGTLFVAGVVVIMLRFRQNGCGAEKKAIAPDVVAQSSMIDSDLHLARRTVQDNDYATMPEGPRAAAAVAPPISSPRPPADSMSGDAANEQIVGADGTIYARLDLAARQASQAQRGGASPPPQPPRPAEPSIYAFIDHTLRVDDLPPRAANKRK